MLRSSIPLSANIDDNNYLKRQSESILKSEHYTEMGKRVKAYRIQSRLTLEQAAEQLGVSVTTVKLFERGKSLTVENLIRICLVYDCTIAEIIPNEFIEYTSPFANILISSVEKQRESMRTILDRTAKRCKAMER